MKFSKTTAALGKQDRKFGLLHKLLICMAVVVLVPGMVTGARVVGTTPGVQFNEAELQLLQTFGPWPATPPPDPGNRLSGKAWAEQLGLQLFHDPDLSGDRSISCATCHQPSRGFADGKALAEGASAHVRNTQSLWNAGFQRWFGWDGGGDSLWAAAIRPMLSPIEMNGDITDIARRLRSKKFFTSALGDADPPVDDASDEALFVFAAQAIGAYTRILVSAETPFDRFRRSLLQPGSGDVNYPLAAQRGLKIFLGPANCHVCHFGANFSNQEFHDTGRPFFSAVGQVDSGRYTGIKRVRGDRYNLSGPYNTTGVAAEIRKTKSVKLNQQNFGQWRTPSLRNLIHTAPYTHDGSLATLRDVVDAYADINPDRLHSNGEAILKPLPLTERDREDLVAFLRSLSAE